MDDIDLNLVGRELDQRIAQRLNRTVHIALDDDIQFMEVAESQPSAHFVQRQHLLGTQALFALQLLTFVGNFAGFLIGIEHMEGVTGSRSTVQTQNQHRFGRSCLFETLVALVEHGLHLTIGSSGQHDVAHMEGTVGHEDGGHIAAALVE